MLRQRIAARRYTDAPDVLLVINRLLLGALPTFFFVIPMGLYGSVVGASIAVVCIAVGFATAVASVPFDHSEFSLRELLERGDFERLRRRMFKRAARANAEAPVGATARLRVEYERQLARDPQAQDAPRAPREQGPLSRAIQEAEAERARKVETERALFARFATLAAENAPLPFQQWADARSDAELMGYSPDELQKWVDVAYGGREVVDGFFSRGVEHILLRDLTAVAKRLDSVQAFELQKRLVNRLRWEREAKERHLTSERQKGAQMERARREIQRSSIADEIARLTAKEARTRREGLHHVADAARAEIARLMALLGRD